MRCGIARPFRALFGVQAISNIYSLTLRADDSGSGADTLVIFTIGPPVIVMLFRLEASFTPGYLLHLMLWPPLVVTGSNSRLRVVKTTLIVLVCGKVDENFFSKFNILRLT